MNSKVKILHIEDNFADQRIVKEYLRDATGVDYIVDAEMRLGSAIQKIKTESYSVILLDLNLPDSNGIETYKTLSTTFPDIPIVILSNMKDESLAKETVQSGAQDYLIKDEIDTKSLEKSIRFAIRRQSVRSQISTNNTASSNQASSLDIVAKQPKVKPGSKPLKEQSPKDFQELVIEFVALLDLEYDGGTYLVKQNEFVEKLVKYKSTGDDLIEIYSAYAASLKQEEINESKSYKVLLELMSLLVTKIYTKISPVKGFKSQKIEVELV